MLTDLPTLVEALPVKQRATKSSEVTPTNKSQYYKATTETPSTTPLLPS